MQQGTEFFRLIAELDVTVTQIKTLYALGACGVAETYSIKEVAERLSLSVAATSRMLDDLVKRGFVQRTEDREDRRIKRIVITPAGTKAIERIQEARILGFTEFFQRFTPEQRSEIKRSLAQIVEIVRTVESQTDSRGGSQ